MISKKGFTGSQKGDVKVFSPAVSLVFVDSAQQLPRSQVHLPPLWSRTVGCLISLCCCCTSVHICIHLFKSPEDTWYLGVIKFCSLVNISNFLLFQIRGLFWGESFCQDSSILLLWQQKLSVIKIQQTLTCVSCQLSPRAPTEVHTHTPAHGRFCCF